LSLDGSADLLTEGEHPFVRDPVVGARPLLAPGERPGFDEHAQMLRDVLLARTEFGGDRPDAQLAVSQHIDDPHPEWVGERAEAAGDQLGELVGKGVRQVHRQSVVFHN